MKTAVIFGADAVYIGGEAFGLRAKAKNFSMQEMEEAKLILEGLDDVEAGRTVDGPTAMAELREKYGL